MIRIIRANEIYFEDGYNRITVGIEKAFCNNEEIKLLEPVYADQVPDDHPAKANAERLKKTYELLIKPHQEI